MKESFSVSEVRFNRLYERNTPDVVRFQKLHKDAIIPGYATPGSAGVDFHCIEDIYISSKAIVPVRTGLAVEMPWYMELQLRPRSGISRQYPGYITNSPATIDPDYRGEIIFYMVNNDPRAVIHFNKGDRIAQGVFAPIFRPEFVEAAELTLTMRGARGHGSSGP